MRPNIVRTRPRRGALAQGLAVMPLLLVMLGSPAVAGRDHFFPGNLVVSRSVYDNNPKDVSAGTVLPRSSRTLMRRSCASISIKSWQPSGKPRRKW